MKIPTLETERLRLRAFSMADWDAYSAMCADVSFVRFLGGEQLSRHGAWKEMATILGHWQLLGYGIWAVESLDQGELVGRVGLLHLPGWPDVEVCWAFSPQSWGKGYATEAAKAAVQWAFTEAGLPRLISLVHPENKASEAVARKIGETLREEITFQGKPTNVFEILNPTQA